jgi:hypothetical protein
MEHDELYTNSFRERIHKELIEPSYYKDIDCHLWAKRVWKHVGDMCETVSKITAAVGAAFAFAAGVFDKTWIAFVAGCLSTGAILLQQFSSYALRESRERTDQVNILLAELQLRKLPIIIMDNDPARSL